MRPMRGGRGGTGEGAEAGIVGVVGVVGSAAAVLIMYAGLEIDGSDDEVGLAVAKSASTLPDMLDDLDDLDDDNEASVDDEAVEDDSDDCESDVTSDGCVRACRCVSVSERESQGACEGRVPRATASCTECRRS